MEDYSRDRREEEFEVSVEEVEKFKTALKDEKFRELLSDYAKEIADPANRRQYEKEITQLEKERGVEVTFLNPLPWFVMKSNVNGEMKCFLNICCNPNIGRPVCQGSSYGTPDNSNKFKWSIPYSLSPPRQDLDKERKISMVYDVLFNPCVMEMSEQNQRFRQVIESTALDAIDENFKVRVDRTNVKYPKMKFKGLPVATVIRKKMGRKPNKAGKVVTDGGLEFPYPDSKNSWINRMKSKKPATLNVNEDGGVKPKYVLKYRKNMDIQEYSLSPIGQPVSMNSVPRELVVEIELPLIKMASSLDLDVTDKRLKLKSVKPTAYSLDLALPHRVDSENSSAKFDVSTRKLTVVLPVKTYSEGTYGVKLEEAECVGTVDSEVSPDDVVCDVEVASEVDGATDYSDVTTRLVTELEEENVDCDVVDDDITGDDVPTKPRVKYVLPGYKFRQTDEKLVVLLQVRNVVPDSLTDVFSKDNSVFRTSFYTIGSGFVPCHYSFAVKCPPGISFDADDYSSGVEEENVIIKLGKADHDQHEWDSVSIGTDVEDASTKIELLTNTNLLAEMGKLEEETNEKLNSRVDHDVVVTCHTREKVEIEFVPVNTNATLSSTGANDCKEASKVASCDINNGDGSSDKRSQSKPTRLRSLSESSVDTQRPKGILKMRRSVSESSDELSSSSSQESAAAAASAESRDDSPPSPQNGAEADIPEETDEEESNEGSSSQSKKCVRFNDVVSQNLFRYNSSILGQRKKNQRKQALKKRAALRRASESENSEGDSDSPRNEMAAESVHESVPNKLDNCFDDDEVDNEDIVDSNMVDNNVIDNNEVSNAVTDNDKVGKKKRSKKCRPNRLDNVRGDTNANNVGALNEDGASTSGDESGANEWKVVNKRTKNRRNKDNCASTSTSTAMDDNDRSVLSWKETSTCKMKMNEVNFENQLMYELDD